MASSSSSGAGRGAPSWRDEVVRLPDGRRQNRRRCLRTGQFISAAEARRRDDEQRTAEAERAAAALLPPPQSTPALAAADRGWGIAADALQALAVAPPPPPPSAPPPPLPQLVAPPAPQLQVPALPSQALLGAPEGVGPSVAAVRATTASAALTTHSFYMHLETFDFLMPDELFRGKT